MRNLLHRIVEAIRREPAAFRQIDGGGYVSEVPRNQPDHLPDKGEAPRRD